MRSAVEGQGGNRDGLAPEVERYARTLEAANVALGRIARDLAADLRRDFGGGLDLRRGARRLCGRAGRTRRAGAPGQPRRGGPVRDGGHAPAAPGAKGPHRPRGGRDRGAARAAGRGQARGRHRPADRRRQPAPARGGAGGGGDAGGRCPVQPAAARHRPLQGLQRPVRPPSGRPGAAADGAAPHRDGQGRRPRGPVRRRGVRGGAARDGPGPRAGVGGEDPGAARDATRQAATRRADAGGDHDFGRGRRVPPRQRLEDLVARTDEALYRAKRGGRDRVEAADEPERDEPPRRAALG